MKQKRKETSIVYFSDYVTTVSNWGSFILRQVSKLRCLYFNSHHYCLRAVPTCYINVLCKFPCLTKDKSDPVTSPSKKYLPVHTINKDL